MPLTCDVLIIGGGIAGLSLASALAGRATVIVAEAEAALASHTSSRSARQLIPSYGPPAIRELTVRTLALLRRTEQETGRRFLTPRSFLLIGDEAQVREQASSHMAFISHAEAIKLSPELRPGSFEAAGLDTTSFGCDTDLLIEHHRTTAEAAGARILTNAPVTAAVRGDGDGGWEVQAGARTIVADTVVNAAGAWADNVAALFGAAPQGLVPYRRTAAVVKVARPLLPEQPMVATADNTFYYRPEGDQVLISPSETEPSRAEDARPRETDIQALVENINSATTMGIEVVDRAWTGLRTEPADGHPVVGFDGQTAGFFWLAGQGGYGFQTSAGLAELAAGLILDGTADGTGVSGETIAALGPRVVRSDDVSRRGQLAARPAKVR